MKGSVEVQLVHVSYTAGTPVEEKAIQSMVTAGVSPVQADVLVKNVFPAAKAIKPGRAPSADQKKTLKASMSKVVNVDL